VLKASNLAAVIDQVTSNTSIKQRAETLGEKVRSEDGIAQGIDYLDLNS
jgi:UDP:flavonoid glycosyltransferase YjiC (YdhE family)